MNAESQLHWCGYRLRDGTVEWPCQLSISTCTASRSRPSVAVAERSARPGGHAHAAWRIRSHRDRQHLVRRAGQPALVRQLAVVADRPDRVQQRRPVEVAGARLQPVGVADLDVPDPGPAATSAASGSASSMFMW